MARRLNSPGSPRPVPWGTPGMWEAQGREDATNAFETDWSHEMRKAGMSPRVFVEELVHENRTAWLVDFVTNFSEDIRDHFGEVDPAYVERAFAAHLRGWKAEVTARLERAGRRS